MRRGIVLQLHNHGDHDTADDDSCRRAQVRKAAHRPPCAEGSSQEECLASQALCTGRHKRRGADAAGDTGGAATGHAGCAATDDHAFDATADDDALGTTAHHHPLESAAEDHHATYATAERRVHTAGRRSGRR